MKSNWFFLNRYLPEVFYAFDINIDIFFACGKLWKSLQGSWSEKMLFVLSDFKSNLGLMLSCSILRKEYSIQECLAVQRQKSYLEKYLEINVWLLKYD